MPTEITYLRKLFVVGIVISKFKKVKIFLSIDNIYRVEFHHG
jgi:hypothetical protein